MARFVGRLMLAALFLFAAAFHFFRAQWFLPIMPPWVPLPMTAIIVSGIAELAGAIGLVIPSIKIQRAAGWGLLLLLVAVFPANIHMAEAHIQVHGIPTKNWMSWARLPFQPIIMFAVSWAAGIWPRPRDQEGIPSPS